MRQTILKRSIAMLVCLCMTMTMLPLSVFANGTAPGILYGDADSDGDVDLQDILLMEKHIGGEQVTIQEANADVNADGVIDGEDVRLVREYLAGNLSSLTPELCTLTFDTAGGGDIEPMTVGKGYSMKKTIPSPAKEDAVFTGWVKADGTPFYQEDAVTADLTLTASYEDVPSSEELHIDSFALTDQSPDVSFQVTGDYASAAEAAANLSVTPKDGSDPVEIDVIDDGNHTYTVRAKNGFTPGASYELVLGDGLTFADKDAALRIAAFTIRKDESDRLYYNENLIFIQDTDAMNYYLDGSSQPLEVLESALLSNEEDVQPITGMFTMPGGTLKPGDLVCIYETTDPRDRDYTQQDYEDDSLAYIEITSVNGEEFSFQSLDEEAAEDVLLMPDSVPFQVDVLPLEGTGSVRKDAYDTAARAKLGFTQAPEYQVNDFLIFYTDEFEEGDENTPVRYAQITGVTEDEVTYKTVSAEYIEEFMGMFVRRDVESEELLENIDTQALLEGVQRQVENSGFADEAASYMLQSSANSESFQNALLARGYTQEDVDSLANAPSLTAAGGGRVKVELEGAPMVNIRLIAGGDRYENGIGIELRISVTLAVKRTNLPGQINIQFTAGFTQEVAVGVDVNIEDEWQWYAFIPVLKELSCTTAIDLKNYTSVSVGARMFTLNGTPEKKKKYDALEDLNHSGLSSDTLLEINKLRSRLIKAEKNTQEAQEYAQQIEELQAMLPSVTVDGVTYSVEDLEQELGMTDVASEFADTLDAESQPEYKVGLEQLMNKYTELLESESEWAQLVNQPIFSEEIHIKIVAIKLSVDFVIRANVNLSIGADVEYETGKRYTFWIHILSMKAGSSEMDLLDERFGFQFYVMGTLGLRVGIKAEVSVGLFSTSLASIGASVEFGPYIKLYGYFFYIYTRLRPANTDVWQEQEDMMGALYVDFGLYLTVRFKAQVFNEAFKYEPTLYDGEYPLLTIGVRKNVYDFAYESGGEDILYIKDNDGDSSNGIHMAMPERIRLMKNIDLVTGEKRQEIYDNGKFYYSVSNRNFSIDEYGVITANPPEGTRNMTANLTVTWKTDKLAFSKYDLSITIPIAWTNLSQSELNERFTVSVAVGSRTNGYETVWSGRYSRLDSINLPSREEILELMQYDSYLYNGVNLKYSDIGGYQTDTTQGLTVTSDTVFYFETTPREYTLNVHGVQKADGSTETRAYTAPYGGSFDLSELRGTGADDPAAGLYTNFYTLTPQGGAEPADLPGLSLPVDLSYTETYGVTADFDAAYLSSALTATYTFLGIQAPPVTITFKKGEIPYYEGLNDYAAQYGATSITSVSPAVAKSEHSVTFTVTCGVSEPLPKHTLTFDTGEGGSAIQPQEYPEGSILFQPEDPRKTGHSFAGWYSDQACTQPFSFADSRMPAENLTLYAKWAANTYWMTYYAFGQVVDRRQVTYGKMVGTIPSWPDDPNLRFLGWFEEGGDTPYWAYTVYNTPGDLNVYARWEDKIVIDPAWISYERKTFQYDGEAKPFSYKLLEESVGYLENSFTVSYKQQADDSAEWTTEAPSEGGIYDVKLTRPLSADYKAFEMVILSAITIQKLKITLVDNGVEVRNGMIRIRTPDGIEGDGKVVYEIWKTVEDGGEEFEENETGQFFVFDRDLRGYVNPKFSYRVRVEEGTNHAAASTQWKYGDATFPTTGSYTLRFTASAADEHNAGATNEVFINPFSAYGNDLSPTLSLGKPGTGKDASVEIANLNPWEVSGYRLKLSDTPKRPSWCVKNVRMYFYKEAGRGFTADRVYENLWIEGLPNNEDVYFPPIDNQTRPFLRNINNTGGFQGGGSGSIDLSGAVSTYTYAYDGVIYDQFYESGYDCMSYSYGPDFYVTSGVDAYDRFIRYTGITSFEIDTVGLAAYLRENGGSDFQYKVIMKFGNDSVVPEDLEHVKAIDVTVPASAKQMAAVHAVDGKFLDTSTTARAVKAPASAQPTELSLFPARLASGVKSLDAFSTAHAVKAPASAQPTGLSLFPARFASGVSANAPFRLTAQDVGTMQGQTFTLPVRMEENPSIWGVLANIRYDTEALELLGCSAGDVFTEEEFTMHNDSTASPYTFLATRSTLENTAENGALVTLTFRVKPQAEEKDYAISVNVLQSVNVSGAVVDAADAGAAVIVDGTAPELIGIEDGKTYCGPQNVTVAEKNIASVTVNGETEELSGNSFLLNPAGTPQTVVVTDRSGNSVSLTVMVNDGHTGGKATCCEQAVCSVCGEAYGEFDANNHAGGTKLCGAKDATETEDGYTGDTCCRGCGQIISAGTAIPATGTGHGSTETGDSIELLLWAAVLFVSGGVLAAVKMKRRNRR